MNSKPGNTQNLTPEAGQDAKLQRDLSVEPPPGPSEIARRAYEMYEERGRDHGVGERPVQLSGFWRKVSA